MGHPSYRSTITYTTHLRTCLHDSVTHLLQMWKFCLFWVFSLMFWSMVFAHTHARTLKSYSHDFFLQNNNKLCNLFSLFGFFFPGFGWELIQCMVSTDAGWVMTSASRDHSLKGQLSFWLLNWQPGAWVLVNHIALGSLKNFKCLGHSDNGFFVAQVSLDDRSEALISWFLPLTQPAKSKHKFSSIMDLLVFLDLRSCRVNGI
jgi:hypothetical protein